MTATTSPRSFICRSASSASDADSARTMRYRDPYCRRRSRATARDTPGSSSTVRIAARLVSSWAVIPPIVGRPRGGAEEGARRPSRTANFWPNGAWCLPPSTASGTAADGKDLDRAIPKEATMASDSSDVLGGEGSSDEIGGEGSSDEIGGEGSSDEIGGEGSSDEIGGEGSSDVLGHGPS